MICKKCKQITKGEILSDKVFKKEVSILWENRQRQLIKIIKNYFGEERGRVFIDTIKNFK